MSMKSSSALYVLFASSVSGAVWVEWHANGESYVLWSQGSQKPACQSSHILVYYTSDHFAEVWENTVGACRRNLITLERLEKDSWRKCQVVRMVGPQNWGCRVFRVSWVWIMVDWKKSKLQIMREGEVVWLNMVRFQDGLISEVSNMRVWRWKQEQGEGALAPSLRSSWATGSFENKVRSDFESCVENGILLAARSFSKV